MTRGVFSVVIPATLLVFFAAFALIAADPPAESDTLPDIEFPVESLPTVESLHAGNLPAGNLNPDDRLSVDDPLSEQRFRDALSGKDVQPTDGLMADFLEIIKNRGSVLDGSVLDGSPPDGSVLDPKLRGGIVREDSRKALVAESLLTASRLLESIDAGGDSAQLVSQMRAEAGNLLTE